MEPPNLAATVAAGGWHPDPTRRFEFRYFNGERWTADVARNGIRYVDPIGGAPPSSGARPSRGMAVTALVFSLCSVTVAWVPFIFVLGAGGAITAFILGVIVLRRSARANNEGQPLAIGQGMAVGAICTSVAALALCILGVHLTRVVLREVGELVNPGPHEVVIDSCRMEDGRAVAEGSILNKDTEPHGYTFNISFRLDGRAWESEGVTVEGVGPGNRVDFTAVSDSVEFSSARLTCSVGTVYGPAPFSEF